MLMSDRPELWLFQEIRSVLSSGINLAVANAELVTTFLNVKYQHGFQLS